VGSDQLFGLECNRSAAKRMAGCVTWAEALLLDMHYVFLQRVPFFVGSHPAWGFCSCFEFCKARSVEACSRWRSPSWVIALLREAGAGLFAVRNYDHLRSCHRSNAGRLDHGQLLVAVDFLHQRSSGNCGPPAGLSACRRSSVHRPPEGPSLGLRLHRIFSPDRRRRRATDRPRQRTGR